MRGIKLKHNEIQSGPFHRKVTIVRIKKNKLSIFGLEKTNEHILSGIGKVKVNGI